MGGSLESKLISLLQENKLEEALELWMDHPQLQNRIDPNAGIRSLHGDTPLHCAARYGSKPLLWLLLDKGGDPFVRNAKGETPMHVVCTSSKQDSTTNAVRGDLLEVLLSKIPDVTGDETYDIVSDEGTVEATSTKQTGNLNLGVVDKKLNTPLHLAAASGLITCVEVLLAHGAPLHMQNAAGQTACDMAVESKQLIIAKLLESRVVLKHQTDSSIFSDGKQKEKRIKDDESLEAVQNEVVAHVATKLNLHHSAAEALLQAYGWSEELVVKNWESDRAAACMNAGLTTSTAPSYVKTMSLTEHECIVCFGSCHGEVLVPCEHHVCRECLISHLELHIKEGGGNQIRCPAVDCYQFIPNDTIKSLVSEDMYAFYSKMKLQNFVMCYRGTKYCPSHGCDAVVALPEEVISSIKVQEIVARPGVNVECSNGHRFCWTCLSEPHEPCCCDLWEKWKSIISGGEKSYLVTEIEWISKCTKSCPNCRVRIEKNEGCNHMTCAKCKHEFCWVCLTPWREHGDKTGGYFTCNRYRKQAEAQKILKKEEDYLKSQVEANQSTLEHYQERYQNHLVSYAIEQQLAKMAAQKNRELAKMKMNLDINLAKVVERIPILQKDAQTLHTGAGQNDACEDNFLQNVMSVLLNARQVLAASYALGYFIPDSRAEDKESYEVLQSNLEDSVERLSQMVNRPYLCTPHSVMVVAARDVDCVCGVFLLNMKKACLSSLLPPPSLNFSSVPAQTPSPVNLPPSPSPPPSPPSYYEPSYPIADLRRRRRYT